MSEAEPNEVWITGIGVVSSLGEGVEAHWKALTASPPMPVVDAERLAPNRYHPLAAVDLDRQIPRRADQRQMEPWQRIGTYAAGLALEDAGIAGKAELLAATDMIVSAGGGERDIRVDNQILETIEAASAPEIFLNERLVNDLRPTLFLAQLPNLLAGNISIVHKVTGSSRSFMGEESAGVSAIAVAMRRIRAGQGDRCLVGGAYNAERKDLILHEALGGFIWGGDWMPVWARAEAGGGMLLSSLGVFLVLESRREAEARGATPHARLVEVQSDRCRRRPGEALANATRQFDGLRPALHGRRTALLSGATGVKAPTLEERGFIEGLVKAGEIEAVRAPGSLLGQSIEAALPMSLAIAAIALRRKDFYPPVDDTGLEQAATAPPESIIVTQWGHWRGEGMALLEALE